MSETANSSTSACCSNWNQTLAAWLLRLLAAAILLISGLDKFKSANPPHTFAWSNYYGTEAELAEGKAPKWSKIVNVIFSNSGLDNASQMPAGIAHLNSRAFALFGQALPFMFLISGALVALGLFRNFGYFLGGITWISLVIGQTLIANPEDMSYLVSFALTCLAGLFLTNYDRFTLDGLFRSSSNE